MSACVLPSLVPDSPAEEIDWTRIEALFAPYGFADMVRTPQNPVFHGEGDVLTHTELVCRELNRMPAFQSLPKRQRE